VWQSSLSDSRLSKFCRNLAGGSTEISDFDADVNSRAPLNYSAITRQVQLGRSAFTGRIAIARVHLMYYEKYGLCLNSESHRKRIHLAVKIKGNALVTTSRVLASFFKQNVCLIVSV